MAQESVTGGFLRSFYILRNIDYFVHLWYIYIRKTILYKER